MGPGFLPWGRLHSLCNSSESLGFQVYPQRCLHSLLLPLLLSGAPLFSCCLSVLWTSKTTHTFRDLLGFMDFSIILVVNIYYSSTVRVYSYVSKNISEKTHQAESGEIRVGFLCPLPPVRGHTQHALSPAVKIYQHLCNVCAQGRLFVTQSSGFSREADHRGTRAHQSSRPQDSKKGARHKK